MTVEEIKAVLRRAVVYKIIRAWSRPAPNVWYIYFVTGCEQKDDEFVEAYAKTLNELYELYDSSTPTS